MEQLLTSGCVDESVMRSVLFSDVVASTELIVRRGHRFWLDVVERHHRSVRALAQAHHGSITNFLGDGFMVVFECAADAIACAVRLQTAGDEHGLAEIRIGVDHGPVTPYEDDWYVGLTIHRASRLTDLCDAGSVMISGDCWAAADTRLDAEAEPRSVRIRGLDQSEQVFVIPASDPASPADVTAELLVAQ